MSLKRLEGLEVPTGMEEVLVALTSLNKEVTPATTDAIVERPAF